MKIAIMQPYFFPYIGYFQLMHCVDEFVIYDNIEYTKKGWINRNRILVNGHDSYITLPLKKDSDYLAIEDRSLSDTWPSYRTGLANRIIAAYRKTPYFSTVYPVIEDCLAFQNNNLFDFILNALTRVKEYLGVSTPFVVSSTIPIDHNLKAEEKVIAICQARNADTYVNLPGGVDLYSRRVFESHGTDLCFLKANELQYDQFGGNYIPNLSIIDVMMFNAKEEIMKYMTSSLPSHSSLVQTALR